MDSLDGFRAPEGTNLYLYLDSVIRSGFSSHSKPLQILSIVCLALYGICFLVSGSVLVLQWRRNELWFFKVANSPRMGRHVLPSATPLFCFFTSIFCLAGIVDLSFMYRVSSDDPSVRVAHWSANAWLWCWQLLAVHSVSWALAAAVAISRRSWGIFRGWMLDAFFLMGFAASVALPVPGAVLTVEHASASYDTYKQLRNEVLLPLALRADSGSNLELSPVLISAMESLRREYLDTRHVFTRTFPVFFAAHFWAGLVFVVVSIVYLVVLRAQQRSVFARSASSLQGRTLLPQSFPVVVCQVVAVGFVELLYIGVSIGILIDPDGAVFGNTPKQVAYQTITYTCFVALALPITAFAAWNGWRDPKPSCERFDPFGPFTLMQRIGVQTEHIVQVDEACGEWSLQLTSEQKLDKFFASSDSSSSSRPNTAVTST